MEKQAGGTGKLSQGLGIESPCVNLGRKGKPKPGLLLLETGGIVNLVCLWRGFIPRPFGGNQDVIEAPANQLETKLYLLFEGGNPYFNSFGSVECLVLSSY